MASSKPGVLYVTMQPKPTLSSEEFHDWYNNEHGPSRLRLPYITNGFRYRAMDLEGPGKGLSEWMAIYDITDMNELTKPQYTRLREPSVKSKREVDTMKQIEVDRKMYDLFESREVEGFKALEVLESDGAEQRKGNVLVAVIFRLFPGKEKEDELHKWYQDEHLDMLMKIPGWRRSRRFITSSIDDGTTEFLALHEFAPSNGLSGEEAKRAISTPWAQEVNTSVVKEREQRLYELYYIFGPAPRHLDLDLACWRSTDGLTRTFPSFHDTDSPQISSYITLPDAVDVEYTLNGSSSPSAPLILLSNSILVDAHIWDAFIVSFLSRRENKKYRILQYNTRGRTAGCNPLNQAITLDVLANDMLHLLDALRVPTAAALIGVSLGGATVLSFALSHPSRCAAVIACDTNSSAPPSNRSSWAERIALAEADKDLYSAHPTSPPAINHPQDRIVGRGLADATARRWFAPENHEGKEWAKVRDNVAASSLAGFKSVVEALFEYDLCEKMKAVDHDAVRAMFVVGAEDGKLPEGMRDMARLWGSENGKDPKEGGKAQFATIAGAGHLPMVERCNVFVSVVEGFLRGG